ncbi:MAG: hypothetical protein V3576_05530, partial [Candidatus Cloacimonadota bacterium]
MTALKLSIAGLAVLIVLKSAIWHAIEREAAKRQMGTISFIGSRLGSPIASEASSNLAYHLASEQTIDGLIIVASSLASYFRCGADPQFLRQSGRSL